ncbi:MAG TPA: RluA family pseudouridine synthase [Patescibacteria group bacterium]|nr:RluA family pseudouridine synthase [Patescibacteria group bacterium]
MSDPQILFEDQDILVVSKPFGMVVNNADTVKNELTLQKWAEDKISNNNQESEFSKRGGIVHRLDRETSGVIVLAKNENSFTNLQAQFKERRVEKKYLALVHGNIEDNEGRVNGKIARVGSFGRFGIDESGRESETNYVVNSRYEMDEEKLRELLDKNEVRLNKNQFSYVKSNGWYYTYISVYPKTGRTHQIRVHMKSEGHPLVSDLIYDPRKLLKMDLLWCNRLFLHAESLSFYHPKTQEKVEFQVNLPEELNNNLSFLKILA